MGGGGCAEARTGRRWALGAQFQGGARHRGLGVGAMVRTQHPGTEAVEARTAQWGVTGAFAPGPGSTPSGFKQRCSGRHRFI